MNQPILALFEYPAHMLVFGASTYIATKQQTITKHDRQGLRHLGSASSEKDLGKSKIRLAVSVCSFFAASARKADYILLLLTVNKFTNSTEIEPKKKETKE